MNHYSSDLEAYLADQLEKLGIEYIHDSDKRNIIKLDFYLPSMDVHIEVKAFYSERAVTQMKRADNVILLQGKKAVEAFCSMINKQGDNV